MTPTSIADFSLQAAKRYLQSAVFIDDNIYNQVSASPDAIVNVEIRQPKTVMQPDIAVEETPKAEISVAERPAVAEPAKEPFRTKDLVGNFADHGIVCALYEPEQNFRTDENSTVFKLCQTADLVILDWDFHEDGVQGTKPKALIENLIKSGNRVAPHHVRLIAIYTNTQSLQSIANSIFQHMARVPIVAEPIDGCAFRLQAGSSRVVVLGKAGGTTRVDPEKPFTVSEMQLANWLLQEFASMNQGILPSCALLGMAAVRQNSRRILDKFRNGLDGQFLLHRALIRGSEEAFDQLPELLGDEFKAIIEDTDYRPDDPTKFVVESSVDVQVKPHSNPWTVEGLDCHVLLKEFFGKENALRKTLKGEREPGSPRRPVVSLAEMCSVSDAQARQRFAALLSVRTQYQVKRRDLGSGVIVLERGSNRYSICITPPCDSLRLKDPTFFPFWRLATSGRGNAVIVQCDDGRLLELIFELGKPSLLMWMEKFTPNETEGIVIATKDGDGKHIFSIGTTEFEWVAKLKPSHAQRIANAIGQQLSRVGLTEAEWARMSFERE